MFRVIFSKNSTEIEATNVTWEDINTLSFDVDFSEAESGYWDIKVINEEESAGILEEAIFIDEPPNPTINSINPTMGGVNKLITISGIKFGSTQQQSRVIFKRGNKEHEAEIYGWSDTQIQCYSPEVENIGDWDVFVQVVNE